MSAHATSFIPSHYWPALLLLLIATACSGLGQPSDEDARNAWFARAEHLGLKGGGHEPEATFQSIKKTNGVAGEVSGVKTYEYFYEVALKCNTDYNFGYGNVKPQTCKTGDIVTETGKLSLYKTENGWQLAPQ